MREAALMRRLDRHTRQLERVERDLATAIETVALFIRFGWRSHRHYPRAQAGAAKAKAAERYRDFVETLGRRLQRGNSLVREISLEIWPEQSSNSLGTAVPTDLDPGAGEIADGR
jgi:hypothetical protein